MHNKDSHTFTFTAPPRLAVLIDAENTSATTSAHLIALATERGNPTIRRAYGDWTNQHLCAWRKVLEHHVIRPVQQFHYRHGKNATDATLIMDAMELLHEPRRKVEGFCIASSDSDYTGLATRIRETGLKVYGFGRADAARSFVSACNEFVVLGTEEDPNDRQRLSVSTPHG